MIALYSSRRISSLANPQIRFRSGIVLVLVLELVLGSLPPYCLSAISKQGNVHWFTASSSTP
jgi:hypothetical protein